MIGDCLNYKIAIQWLSSRPIGVPFARCVTTLGPDHKRDRIESVPTKSVDALALDRQKDPRPIAPKVTLDDREERFTLECMGRKSRCGYSFMETTGHRGAWRQD